ncbi:hypothetical protein Pelo_15735 [Pelomyxa schiedti]|nr:hypothetical protein Pelo_15735 [Pelomyxa schiedti]
MGTRWFLGSSVALKLTSATSSYTNKMVAEWCSEPANEQYWTDVYFDFDKTVYGHVHSNDTYTGLCNTSQFSDAWYTFQPSVDGELVVSTCGTTWDTVIEVQCGFTCNSRSCVASNDDGCIPASISILSVNAHEFYNIRIRPYAYYTVTSQYTFNLEFTPTIKSSSQSSSSESSSSLQSNYYFCPDRIYISNEGSETYALTSGIYVNTGDCWDDDFTGEYGLWFEYFTGDPLTLSLCAEFPITLIFVAKLCESTTSPYNCYYTSSSTWKGWDDCEYQIEVDMDINWNVKFLVKTQYYDTRITDHFPIWLVVLAFGLLFLCLGLFCLLGAFWCHRRIIKKRNAQYPPLVESTCCINTQPASGENTQPPSVEPTYTPFYGCVSGFQEQQQQVLFTPPTQPPPPGLYPTITLPLPTQTTSNN